MYGVMIVYDASSQLAIRFLSKPVNSSALLLSNIAILSCYPLVTHVIIDGFSVYFDCILNEKMLLFSYRNNDISRTHARGHATMREFFFIMCNFMRLGEYFDQILY